MGKSTNFLWPFSMAMLNYQRVQTNIQRFWWNVVNLSIWSCWDGFPSLSPWKKCHFVAYKKIHQRNTRLAIHRYIYIIIIIHIPELNIHIYIYILYIYKSYIYTYIHHIYINTHVIYIYPLYSHWYPINISTWPRGESIKQDTIRDVWLLRHGASAQRLSSGWDSMVKY